MKKFLILFGLLVVVTVSISLQNVKENKVDINQEEVVIEEDLHVEDWMTQPFITFT